MERIHPQKTKDERNGDLFCHRAVLAMFIIPFGNVIGSFLLIGLRVINLVMIVVASVRANADESFQYPLSQYFIRLEPDFVKIRA